MRITNYAVLMIGLLAFGFMTADALAIEPKIVWMEPGGTPRFTENTDLFDPIVINAKVSFPLESTPCVGEPPPVIQDTLVLNVYRQTDRDEEESWLDLDTSSWVWGKTDKGVDEVTGPVSIGGTGMIRSLYTIQVCISNGTETGCAKKLVRVEHPVSEFAGGDFTVRGQGLSQNPGCNVLPGWALPVINQQMSSTTFDAYVPSASGISSSVPVVFDGIPLLLYLVMSASLNDEGTNNVDLASVPISGIDIGALNLPFDGLNCLIQGSADGVLYGEVSPGQDLDGEIRVFGMSVGLGGGPPGSTCTLVADDGCELRIVFDGDPL